MRWTGRGCGEGLTYDRLAGAVPTKHSVEDLTFMASVATLPAHTRVEHRELSDSMDRVREELGKVRSAPDADNVHDLRVAIRRCRAVATVFEEIDPDTAWPEMRRTARKLFRALGALRDAHVMAD